MASLPTRDYVSEIITSPEASRMLQMVTKDMYNQSRIALWLFQVIGQEWDEMYTWSSSLQAEAVPQTATWSLYIWEELYGIPTDESLPIDYRRDQILSKRLQRPPINPARIEAILTALIQTKVTVTENTGPYQFSVSVEDPEIPESELRRAYKLLRKIKPSHLSLFIEHLIRGEFFNTEAFYLSEVKFGPYRFESGRQIIGHTFDGTWSFDGSVLFDARYTSGLDFKLFQVEMPIAQTVSTFSGGKLIQDNRWTFDGSVTFGDNRPFSYYSEEDL